MDWNAFFIKTKKKKINLQGLKLKKKKKTTMTKKKGFILYYSYEIAVKEISKTTENLKRKR